MSVSGTEKAIGIQKEHAYGVISLKKISSIVTNIKRKMIFNVIQAPVMH